MAEVVEQLDFRGRPRSLYQTVNDEPSMTVQSDAPKADIQKILQKYKQVGIVESLNDAQARFMDISEFTDYADAMRQLKTAEEHFMRLPSKVREIFNHNVAEWLDAAEDPEKRDALVEAGFVEAVEAPVEGAAGGDPAGDIPAELPLED